jgi:hypothetical protein
MLMRVVFYSLLSSAMVGCTSIRDYPDPHHHKVQVHAGTKSAFHAHALLIKGASNLDLKEDPKAKVVRNHANTRSAYLAKRKLSGRSAYDSPVIILKSQKDEPVCLLTDEWPFRPLADPVWLTDRLLVFDLWTGPSYGWHYVFDARRKRVMFVDGFWDEYGD